MRRALAAAAALVVALAAPAAARADSVFVFAQTQSFSPKTVDVLTGDTVIWRNTSQKTHNVKFDKEGYNSGRFGPGEVRNHPFPTAGVYAYHCTIHTGMTGAVGVYPLVLSASATRVRPGTSVAFHVRAPEGAGGVRIEGDTGGGFHTVAVAGPAVGGGHEGHDAPGTVHADVVVAQTAVYRAVFSGGASQELRIEVSDAPVVSVRARRVGRTALVRVTGRPSAPGARVVLELKLRERFGWWPVARGRLDGHSRARFRVRGHAGVRARVVVVGRDWATPLGRSRVLKLPH
jgi:plastocyanin